MTVIIFLSFIVLLARTIVFSSNATVLYDSNILELPLISSIVFDMYILAQSWQPAFCYHKEQQYPGCHTPETYWRSHLTLHGLWPERYNLIPPSFCTDEAFDANKIERAVGIETLHQYWPDVKYRVTSRKYTDFWKHEWTRHGTCSGLKQVEYFTYAIDLERNETLAPTPQIVQDNIGGYVDAKILRKAFGEAALVCEKVHGNNNGTMFLQVFTCWEKDEHNVPIRRRACPAHIHSEDTCGTGIVAIPAFRALDSN